MFESVICADEDECETLSCMPIDYSYLRVNEWRRRRDARRRFGSPPGLAEWLGMFPDLKDFDRGDGNND
jgi:hypothetical protein